MSEPGRGPSGRRRGRGARERIFGAAQQLFVERGIHNTAMDELCAVACVSKRTVYQHFGSKDELLTEYLRQLSCDSTPPAELDQLAPRERVLAVFEKSLTLEAAPLCLFIGAAVEIVDPEHPARVLARGHHRALGARLAETARDAGADDPEVLGEQLALLLDGAAARTHALGIDAIPTAVAIATRLIDDAVPATENA